MFTFLVCHALIVAASCELFTSESGYILNYAPEYHNYQPRDYQFSYGVSDPHTGDHKTQWEVREKGVVRGAYSLLEPDGTTRVVEYVADDDGFRAVVSKLGTATHPVPVVPSHYKTYDGQVANYAAAAPVLQQNIGLVENPQAAIQVVPTLAHSHSNVVIKEPQPQILSTPEHVVPQILSYPPQQAEHVVPQQILNVEQVIPQNVLPQQELLKSEHVVPQLLGYPQNIAPQQILTAPEHVVPQQVLNVPQILRTSQNVLPQAPEHIVPQQILKSEHVVPQLLGYAQNIGPQQILTAPEHVVPQQVLNVPQILSSSQNVLPQAPEHVVPQQILQQEQILGNPQEVVHQQILRVPEHEAPQQILNPEQYLSYQQAVPQNILAAGHQQVLSNPVQGQHFANSEIVKEVPNYNPYVEATVPQEFNSVQGQYNQVPEELSRPVSPSYNTNIEYRDLSGYSAPVPSQSGEVPNLVPSQPSKRQNKLLIYYPEKH